MKAIGTNELHSERLVLRKIQISDSDTLFMAGVLGNTMEEAREIVCNMIKYNDDPYNFHWTIEYNGKAIGRVKAWEINCSNNFAQLGYDIGSDYRCMGLMTEAVRTVVRYMLQEAEFNRIYCMVRENNAPSARVCEKVGMTCEGTMRRHFAEEDGSYVDVRVYGILSSECL